MSGLQSTETEAALEDFSSAQTTSQQRTAAQTLARLKVLEAAKTDSRFKTGIKRLAEAASIGAPEDRTEAIVLMMRTIAVVKTLRKEVPKLLSAALSQPIASAQSMEDPKDREYLAQALALATGDWVVRHVATEAVLEENGENARKLLLEVLLAKAPAVNFALEALAEAFQNLSTKTADAAATRARRLQRVAHALRPAIMKSDTCAGPDVGLALKRMLSAAIGGKSTFNLQLRTDVAVAILGVLFELIRVHFSLATEAKSYSVIADLRNFFQPGNWPDRLVPAIRSMALQIEEAVTLLAKQGLTDNQLRTCLATLIGELPAERRLAALAESISGLEPAVRRWLAGGPKVRQIRETPIAAESQLRQIDQRIASLFRDAAEIVPELTAATSQESDVKTKESRSLLFAARRILDQISFLAMNRGMRLRGRRGEEVAFLPAEHDLGEHPMGSRTVRIVRPAVERETPVGTHEIVMRADVEPV